MFTFGQASERNLEGVDPRLVRCARRALAVSMVDFGVHDGVRTLAEQQENVRDGVSKSLDSYHLIGEDGYGHALDLVPFIRGKLRWQEEPGFQVLIAMRNAALAFTVPITCGAVWDRRIDELDPRDLEGEIEAYVARYKARRGPKARPLFDLWHYQVDR